VWNGTEWPQDLPSLMQPENKPGSPLLGNGNLGLAVAAYPTDRGMNASLPGLGLTNSLYGFLGSNNFWSCNDAVLVNGTSGCYGTTNDTRPDGACCQRVGLGGVALQFTPTWGSNTSATPSFRQVLANGTIEARWPTPGGGGGAVSTLSAMLHDSNLLSTRVEYAAGAGDAATLVFDVLTWVGAIAGPQKGNSGQPRNSAAGCADLSGAPAACGVGPQLVYASRRAATDFIGPNGFPHTAHAMPVNATIATGVLLGPGAAVQSASVLNGGDPNQLTWAVRQRVALPAGSWVEVLSAETESRGPGAVDPAPAALAAVVAAQAGPPGAVVASSVSWWANFWPTSAISLPNQPDVEAFWFGCQYLLACASSDSPLVAAPGLYGPWVTADGPRWHGDYTLDFNYQAQYYGVFGSNHATSAESYFTPILDWIRRAGPKAQVQSHLANVTCPSDALYFACHLAPWGQTSPDLMEHYASTQPNSPPSHPPIHPPTHS